ncbi:alpha-N-acetylneuraminide alpha-2,8-sialyltransferase-like [Diadema setosum]|uniref:alpha-N-acetylneuraminide alpha-2,8-sialyltransferase-like n=1 Tax=Diadema setosum TaxID=31175 RepID=UPI003B3A5BE0
MASSRSLGCEFEPTLKWPRTDVKTQTTRDQFWNLILKHVNPNTTLRIFRRDVAPADFQYGLGIRTVVSQNVTRPLPKIGPRCAVVGSSGLLEGSRCGSAIDDNDFVFRVNLSPVGGPFEDDVGSKINVTTINRSQVWGIPIASTGFSVITVALLHCDDVTLYGFYPFPRDSQNRELRYHYYEDDGKETTGGHNMNEEYARLQKLDADGVLRLVTEPCVAGE